MVVGHVCGIKILGETKWQDKYIGCRGEFKLKGSVGLLKLEGAEGQLSGFIHRSLAGCLGGASAAEWIPLSAWAIDKYNVTSSVESGILSSGQTPRT